LPQEEESALTLNGKRSKLQKSDFLILAEKLEIESKSIERIFQRYWQAKPKIFEMVRDCELSAELKDRFISVMNSRYSQMVD
jgi:serine/threonine-protein kinase HipA